jgi:sarcosine oxidase subunit beta
MRRTAGVVVIGGGVVGTSTAFHLATSGAKDIMLLERRFLGAGATGKSGAVVRMHYTNQHDAALAQESLPYFQRWDDVVGAGDPGFVRTGVVRFVAPEHDPQLRANVTMLRDVGVNTELITPDDVRELDPGCRVDDITCAAYEPDSGYADPSATAFGFAARARQLGVAVQTGIEATAIVTDKDRVVGVETTDGAIATDTVVLANGAWAPPLLARLGLDFGLRPNRVQVVIFRRPEDAPQTHLTILDGHEGMWLRPEGRAGTLAGLGIDQFGVDPSAYDETVDPDYVEQVRRCLVHRRPAMVDAPMRGGWAGVITMSPDTHAIIDHIPAYRGLYCALGDSGTNFKTAPAIGKCLAEWIVDGSPRTVDLRPFRSSRFADQELLVGAHEYGDEPMNVFR